MEICLIIVLALQWWWFSLYGGLDLLLSDTVVDDGRVLANIMILFLCVVGCLLWTVILCSLFFLLILAPRLSHSWIGLILVTLKLLELVILHQNIQIYSIHLQPLKLSILCPTNLNLSINLNLLLYLVTRHVLTIIKHLWAMTAEITGRQSSIDIR